MAGLAALGRAARGVLPWACAAGLLAQPLSFRHFSDRDGVPQSQVSALLEDRDGFIWLGAQGSVARIGPSGIRAFAAGQGLKATQIGALMQDRQGSVWAADLERGLFEIRGGLIRAYGPKEGLARPEIYSLLEGEDGSIYAGSRLGLFRKRPGKAFEEVELPDQWRHSAIVALARDPSGKGIWMGSVWGSLALWDGQKATTALLPAAFSRSVVWGMQADARGRLWALLSDGLVRLQGGQWVRVPLPDLQEGVRFQGFSIDPAGEILIALGPDGVYQLLPDGRHRILTRRDGLPRQAIQAVLRDRHGVMWVGTDGDYVAAQVLPGLRNIQNDPMTGQNLALGDVMGFLELQPGRILICSSGSGLYLWEDGRGISGHWTLKDGLPSDDCWALGHGPKGGVWVGTLKGIALWRNGVITKGPKELERSQVTGFFNHGGRLWLSSDNGLGELSLEGRFLALHPAPQAAGYPGINDAVPWGDDILVGTRLGLFRFHEGRFTKDMELANSPADKGIVSLLRKDDLGRLWVANTEGLFCGTPKGGRLEWSWVNSRDLGSNTSPNFFSLLPSGTLVVGHNQGVSFYRSGRLVLLTRNHGLVSSEANQNAVLRDSKGRLWIGMIGGACVLDAGTEPQPPSVPKPRVVEATWNGGAAWLPNSIELPANPGNLTLSMDLGLPITPEAPRYQTWLEGLDSEWRTLGEKLTSIQIARLSYGSYRFHIRVSLDGTNWVESDPFQIHVRRAWYQTHVVRALFALATLALLLAGVRWRMRRLEERARLLETKVDERTAQLDLRNKALERLHHQLKHSLQSRVQLMNTVTHDLRSPLTSILLSVERLRLAAGSGQDLDPKLDLLEREAQRLETILKSLLDQSKSESLTDSLNQRLCHPSEVLHGIADTLKLKAETKELHSEFSVDAASGTVWVLADAASMQQVLFNLVENALKFTPSAGSVGVRARVQGDRWIMEVWDTGRGIASEKLDSIFQAFQQAEEGDHRTGWGLGLSICKSMVEAHQGRIEVESQVGKGSTFRVVLPLVVPGKPA